MARRPRPRFSAGGRRSHGPINLVPGNSTEGGMITRRHLLAAAGGLAALTAAAPGAADTAARPEPAERRNEQWRSRAVVRSRPARDRRKISPARFAWTRYSRRPTRRASAAAASRSNRALAVPGIRIRSARL